MKEIELTVDGKEIPLTDEQIKAFGIDIDDGCVCDKVDIGEVYFYINPMGEVKEMRLRTSYPMEDY